MSNSETSECSKGTPNKSLYLPTICRVESVSDLTHLEKLYRLVKLDGSGFGHKPGQFVQLSIFGIGEAPISVSSSPTRGNYLELGVRKAGRLTGALHDNVKPGSTVGIRGPFGSYFDVESMRGRNLLLISGGCGLAPMRALIQYCEDCRGDFKDVTVLYGAKSPQDLLYKEEINEWERSEKLAMKHTVDAVPGGTCWDGNVGLITTLIPPLNIDPDNTTAVIVGPPVMYKYVIQELHKKGVTDDKIIVSLERHMKCGVGKCGHCTIEHLYCCIDGPVFRLDEVINLKGAI